MGEHGLQPERTFRPVGKAGKPLSHSAHAIKLVPVRSDRRSHSSKPPKDADLITMVCSTSALRTAPRCSSWPPGLLQPRGPEAAAAASTAASSGAAAGHTSQQSSTDEVHVCKIGQTYRRKRLPRLPLQCILLPLLASQLLQPKSHN